MLKLLVTIFARNTKSFAIALQLQFHFRFFFFSSAIFLDGLKKSLWCMFHILLPRTRRTSTELKSYDAL